VATLVPTENDPQDRQVTDNNGDVVQKFAFAREFDYFV
jgi:hypothetical protein